MQRTCRVSGTLRRCEYSGLSTDVHRLILYSVKGNVMRQPKPWYRKSTRSWCVQIGRKQVRLGRDQRQAWVKYHELMSVSRGAEPAAARLSVCAGTPAPRAVTVRPGRDNGPVVSEPAPPERYRPTCSERFPRDKFTDGSSLDFIVRSFPSRLDFEGR